MIKLNKGISLVSLVITIAVMLIITSITVSVSYNRFEINNLNKLKNDLELLEDKVSNYYLKYNVIPVLRKKDDNTIIKYDETTLNFNKDVRDNGNYYIIDLEAMDGISLNYGKEGFENPNTSDDVYIINQKSHQIYYVRGIELDGEFYHSILDNKSLEDSIPPSKPEINVISGLENKEQVYLTNVSIEIIPGKDNVSEITKTTYSINGSMEKELENNIVQLTEDGEFNIKAKTYNKLGLFSENLIDIKINKIKVGDKVAYDEGSGRTSTIDSGFIMKDMNWRVLNIKEDGIIELISTQPTSDTFSIAKTEEAWLASEEDLDTLCNDLYGKGTGAKSARSLKIEDINNLIENFTPTDYVGRYGKWYYYKWDSSDSSATKVKVSTDYNEETKEGNWSDTTYATFKVPGKKIIDSNSENYLDANGEERIIKLQMNYLYYLIEEKISSDLISRDGILIFQLITQGLDDTNTTVSGTNQKQWLSSKYVDCFEGYAEFGMLRTDGNGAVSDREQWYSYGSELSGSYYYVIRPVVKVDLNSAIDFTFVDDEWQISE